MKTATDSQSGDTSKIVIEGQGSFEVETSGITFNHGFIEVVLNLKSLPRVTRSFYLRFSDRSQHLDAVAFTAEYSDSSPDYLYKYKSDSGGADTFIDLSSKRAIGIFNLDMKQVNYKPGWGPEVITVHGWFDLSN